MTSSVERGTCGIDLTEAIDRGDLESVRRLLEETEVYVRQKSSMPAQQVEAYVGLDYWVATSQAALHGKLHNVEFFVKEKGV